MAFARTRTAMVPSNASRTASGSITEFALSVKDVQEQNFESSSKYSEVQEGAGGSREMIFEVK